MVLVAVLARAFDLQAEVARIAEATAKTYGCEIAVAVESPVGRSAGVRMHSSDLV